MIEKTKRLFQNKKKNKEKKEIENGGRKESTGKSDDALIEESDSFRENGNNMILKENLISEEKDNDNEKIIKIDDNEFYVVDEDDFGDYDTPSEKNEGKHIYSILFWVFVILNVIIFVACFLFEAELKSYHPYVEFGHGIFCVFVSVVLLCFAIKIRVLMGDEMFEEYKEIVRAATTLANESDFDIKFEEDLEKNKDNIESDLYKNNLFLKTRNKQLMIISISNLLTNFIELSVSTFICFNFDILSDYFYKINHLSFLTESFCNFISFYYIIRKTFKINYKKISDIRDEDKKLIINIIGNNQNEENGIKNKDIEEFIG